MSWCPPARRPRSKTRGYRTAHLRQDERTRKLERRAAAKLTKLEEKSQARGDGRVNAAMKGCVDR